MFTHYRTRGIILKKTDRGEYDRIFTVYTKDFGKLELLAKSERKIKSKLRNGLELFYLSDIEFIQGKGYKTLTDAVLVNDFKNLRRDLEKLFLAFKVSDVLDFFINGEEPDLKIWDLLQEVLANEASKQLIYYYFLWNLFSIMGYQPDLYFCSACRKKIAPRKIYFNFKIGGLICDSCPFATVQEEIDQNTVKIIRIILKNDWKILKKIKVNEEDLRLLEVFSKQYCAETLRKME